MKQNLHHERKSFWSAFDIPESEKQMKVTAAGQTSGLVPLSGKTLDWPFIRFEREWKASSTI